MEFSHPTGKIFVTGKVRHYFSGSAGIRRVPGHIALEWRSYKRWPLVRHPILRQDPSDTCSLSIRVGNMLRPTPREKLNLVDVGTILHFKRIARLNQFNVSRD